MTIFPAAVANLTDQPTGPIPLLRRLAAALAHRRPTHSYAPRLFGRIQFVPNSTEAATRLHNLSNGANLRG